MKANWLKIIIWTMLGLQVVAALPFIAEPFLAADVTARFVSGTLGLSLLASATAGFYATCTPAAETNSKLPPSMRARCANLGRTLADMPLLGSLNSPSLAVLQLRTTPGMTTRPERPQCWASCLCR